MNKHEVVSIDSNQRKVIENVTIMSITILFDILHNLKHLKTEYKNVKICKNFLKFVNLSYFNMAS